LRQYVFVHRAILEGAMQMVDELREEMAKREAVVAAGVSVTETPDTPMDLGSPRKEIASPFNTLSSQLAKASPARPSGYSFNLSNLAQAGSGFDLLKPSSTSGLGGKRLASPTELLRTDVTGARTISKRPSLKRIARSTDVGSDLQMQR